MRIRSLSGHDGSRAHKPGPRHHPPRLQKTILTAASVPATMWEPAKVRILRFVILSAATGGSEVEGPLYPRPCGCPILVRASELGWERRTRSVIPTGAAVSAA